MAIEDLLYSSYKPGIMFGSFVLRMDEFLSEGMVTLKSEDHPHTCTSS